MSTVSLHPARSPLAALLLVGVVYVLAALLIEHHGLWIIDNQIKFLQVEQILATHGRSYAMPWPGSALDPELRFQPMIFPFFAVRDHTLYPAYTPIFPLLSAIPFATFGFGGLSLLPLLGGLLSAWGAARLARICALSASAQSLSAVLAGLLTPLWFYSEVYWEHTLAVAACLWGVGFVLQFLQAGSWKRLASGGALCATGIYLRDDLYVFCAALALMTFLRTPRSRLRTAAVLGAAMIGALLPLWFFQAWAIGQPFGFHIGVHVFDFPGLGQHFAERPAVIYRLFVRCASNPWLSIVLLAPFLVGFLLRPRLSTEAFRWTIPGVALWSLAGFLFVMRGYFEAESPILHMIQVNTLFAVSPILVCAFWRNQEDASLLSSFVWPLTLIYVVVYSLVSPLDATEGVHWGNRLVLVLYPLFAVMAAEQITHWTPRAGKASAFGTGVLIITAVASLLGQAYSVWLLDRKQTVTKQLNEMVAARPERAILTDLWWVPLEIYSVFPERPIFRVRSQDQINELLAILKQAGYEACLLVTGPGRPTSLPPVAIFEDETTHCRMVKLIRIDLGS
ncbi:MAG: hypothetical protein KC729_13975 [Candidatus Eisenbacteria bacterium]|uniref:Uncharacterized protein n=1 Tax=Eiseniibacteriota bacterium TaxID=2212470 RepID=A0A956M042_UNCEI|nr:hypothetical protein [Candidatus Eisenbacteria bacterium]